jgi:tRNA-dihydrouridine synthase
MAIVFLPYIASAESIVDFIIVNNPEIQELKSINRNILKHLKVEASGRASYGQLTRERETTIEQAKTRYDIGLTASIPIISPNEKAQRRIEEAQKERIIRLEVVELISKYKSEQKALDVENKVLADMYHEIQWMGKRVETGVDSQKEYNQKLHEYNTRRRDYEYRKAQAGYILEKILSYVSADKRERLKGMLNGQDISKN